MSTHQPRTEAGFRALILGILGDFHSHEDAWHISEARKHTLQDNMGTSTEQRDCEAYSATLYNRAVGCWEVEAYKVIKPAWLAGTTKRTKTDDIYRWPQNMTAEFGEQVSIKREQEIATLIRNNILGTDSQIRAAIATYKETLNDITLTWRSGNGTITIINGDGTEELPRQIFSGNSITFDAPARVRIERIIPADSEGPLFDLAIAPDYKGVITANNDSMESETITNTARDTHTLDIETHDEFIAKLTGTRHIEADIRTA